MNTLIQSSQQYVIYYYSDEIGGFFDDYLVPGRMPTNVVLAKRMSERCREFKMRRLLYGDWDSLHYCANKKV